MTAPANKAPRPPEGYNLAILRPSPLTAQQALDFFIADQGVLVLREAREPLGVLRALQTRMGPIKLDAPEYTLALYRWLDTNPAMELWSLKSNLTPHRDDRANYARDARDAHKAD
jgi:hypothetical protein